MKPPRRVITGLDAQGRSCVLFDDVASTGIWSTGEIPADNSGIADAGAPTIQFPRSGSQFVYVDFAPGSESIMHATNTIDYIVVTAGEVVFVTETGDTLLRTGDVIVDRGVLHAWRNQGDAPCRIMVVLCPSHPVGAGATIT